MHDKRPFVVVFATPKYCTSRTCGPVVDVVSAVRRRPTSAGLSFVHVEIYKDNDPAKGENRWVREWKLPSEPWIFLVGADGRVRERFEGTVSVQELDAAVRRLQRERRSFRRFPVGQTGAMGSKARRALEVGRVARQRKLLRVLREVGVVGDKPATPEGARAFRLSLEELGTTFVKLGQLLSSRPDLLPDEYIAELEKLVDDVPPFPFEEARRIIDEEVGLEHFVAPRREPVASASIAQIHGALLRNGREVVVKVRRPGIEERGRARPPASPLADVVRGGSLRDRPAPAAEGARRGARGASARRAQLRRRRPTAPS